MTAAAPVWQMPSMADVSWTRTLETEWHGAFAWVERTLGGRIVRYERRARWRPAFDLDVERRGSLLAVHFRGERNPGQKVYGLRPEYEILRVLEQQGLPVPPIHGFCEAPAGILMSRMPGRPSLATVEDLGERERIFDEFIDELVRLHALDPDLFRAVGIDVPTGDYSLAWDDFAYWLEIYRALKTQPEPAIELVMAWMHRNAPEPSGETVFLQGDAGQFIFDKGHLTSLLDFEVGHLGDPAHDLAALYIRDTSEPLGDVDRAVNRYCARSGRRFSQELLSFLMLQFCMTTPMPVGPMLRRTWPLQEPMQYLSWHQCYMRLSLEIVARQSGIKLVRPDLPEPAGTLASGGHRALHALLSQGLGVTENARTYPFQVALRLAGYLERASEYGPALEADDLRDCKQLLGRELPSWRQAEAALETRALERDGTDAELLVLLHRHHCRQEFIAAPLMNELRDATLQFPDP
jgi:aminoglycoside phosphotransferase (APT) family kinase protein